MSDAVSLSWPDDSQDWRAERWQRQSYDRLYVRTADGTPIGWYDLHSGDVHALDLDRCVALLEFVRDWAEEMRRSGCILPDPACIDCHRGRIRPVRR